MPGAGAAADHSAGAFTPAGPAAATAAVATEATDGAAGSSLLFLVSLDDEDAAGGPGGDMGIFGRGPAEPRLRDIPAAVLKENLRRTVAGLREVFGEIAAQDGPLALQQAQIAFEVTASGGVALVGTSAQLAAKGAITLTFGPRPAL